MATKLKNNSRGYQQTSKDYFSVSAFLTVKKTLVSIPI
jgi:hypothetical protein